MKTYVALVLDRSSSMEKITTQTVMLYNEQVQQLKLDAKEGDTSLCSLITFNGHVYEHLWNVPAAQLTESTDEDYRPEGATALYDAVCYTINKLLKEEQKDARFLIMVITDGEDTMFGRTKYNLDAMVKTITKVEKKGNWTVTFMGCDKHALTTLANQTGLKQGNVAVWDPDQADKAFEGHTKALRAYLDAKDHEVKTSGFYGDACLDFTSPKAGRSDFGTPTWRVQPSVTMDWCEGTTVKGSMDYMMHNSVAPRGVLRASNHLDDAPVAMNNIHTWSEGSTNVFGSSHKVDLG